MYYLSCLSITKPLALASLPSPTNDDSPPLQTNHIKPPPTRTTKPTIPPTRQQQQQQQKKRKQPSITQIERAIRAGRFRDMDARELEEEKNTTFDLMSMSFTGKFEGPVEKKLRETGEWLSAWSETEFRAAAGWVPAECRGGPACCVEAVKPSVEIMLPKTFNSSAINMSIL